MRIEEALESFRGRTVCVIGDVMLDEYIWGRASRISPEAPVIVLEAQRDGRVPGGSANVAHNIVALGGKPLLVGVIGTDVAGHSLKEVLLELGIGCDFLVESPDRITTRKTRIIAQHQQVIRVDREQRTDLNVSAADKLMENATRALESAEAAILSDYRKGCLNEDRVHAIVSFARELGIPCVANPKPESIRWMYGTDLVSLNRAEAQEVTGSRDESASMSPEQLVAAVTEHLACNGIPQGLITMGEDGMYLCGRHFERVPALRVEVYDTTGAGDTVIAVMGLSAAAALPLGRAARIATIAAGCVVRHVGVAVPTPEEVAYLASIHGVSV